MKIPLPALIAVATILSFSSLALAGDPGWGTDYAKALERAKAENKAVLVYFMSSEDSTCARIRDETLTTPDFKHYAKSNFILVVMDFGHHQAGLSPAIKEQNDNLGQKLGIGGFPVFAVIDASGKPLGQIGYVAGGPGPFIAKLSAIYKAAAGGSTGSAGGGSDDFDSLFKKPAGSSTP